jgi:hypothetical protein
MAHTPDSSPGLPALSAVENAYAIAVTGWMAAQLLVKPEASFDLTRRNLQPDYTREKIAPHVVAGLQGYGIDASIERTADPAIQAFRKNQGS